jgi:hypothetical protein
MDDRRLQVVIGTQGAYFVATGLWALVDLDSFERVTGPKTDKWLVKTVGVLVTVIGGALIGAASRRRVTAETVGLAAGAAIGLGAIDVVYATRGRISRIYLADALVEGCLAGLTAASAWTARTS